MPNYRVWYRNSPEPLEFATIYRCSEMEILEHIFAHEHIVPLVIPPVQRGDPSSFTPSLSELIARHDLAPVRFTEDESEINTIE